MKFNVACVAKEAVLGKDPDGKDITGFKLGTAADKTAKKTTNVPLANVTSLKKVGTTHLFVKSVSEATAAKAMGWEEFRAVAPQMNFYVDLMVRIAAGLSNGTWAELKHMIMAHWYKDDGDGEGPHWHHKPYIDWEAAGKPSKVWFSPIRQFFGQGMF